MLLRPVPFDTSAASLLNIDDTSQDVLYGSAVTVTFNSHRRSMVENLNILKDNLKINNENQMKMKINLQ